MMNRRAAAIAISVPVLCAFGQSPSEAHLGDVIFPVYEIPTSDLPDLHDGTLADWEEILIGGSLDHTYFAPVGGDRVIDPGDLAVRFFLAWHYPTGRLYVAAERLDDVYLPPKICCDGLFGLMIDGDHSGGQYEFLGDEYSDDQSRRLSGAQAQSYSIYMEVAPGQDPFLSTTDWTTELPWADHGGWQFGEAPNLGGVEFYVTPWDNLIFDDPDGSKRSSLAPGSVIGFNLSIFDADEAGIVSGRYMLAEPTSEVTVTQDGLQVSHFAFADNFVDGELIPCHVQDCSESSTVGRVDTWARIKASLR